MKPSEERLDQLREEAARSGGTVAGTLLSYYGVPLLKPPVWTWEIPTYFFVGGAGGAAAVLASIAQLTGADEDLVRDARWIAAGGAGLSAPLLIADLGRPERFLNMLRIFKLQSPMSVGAWTVAAFGAASTAAAFADFIRRRTNLPVRLLGDAAGVVSAATGLVMATYTGVLIGASPACRARISHGCRGCGRRRARRAMSSPSSTRRSPKPWPIQPCTAA